jgi:hypothetical protein
MVFHWSPWLRDWRTTAPTAAVFHQEARQAIHGLQTGRIADGATVFVGQDELRCGQDVQMEGKSWTWKTQATGDLSRREAIRSIPNEQAKDIEARFLSECGHRLDCVRYLHNSKTMEVYDIGRDCQSGATVL